MWRKLAMFRSALCPRLIPAEAQAEVALVEEINERLHPDSGMSVRNHLGCGPPMMTSRPKKGS